MVSALASWPASMSCLRSRRISAVVVEALLDYVGEHLQATARLETLLDMHRDPTRADLENLHKSATRLAGIGRIIVEYRQSQLMDEAAGGR